VDPKTIQYYDDHSNELFAVYSCTDSGPAKYFKVAFPPGSEILDIGTGSGRDLCTLIHEKYEAYGAEPSPRLRGLALQIPALEDRIWEGALPELAAQIGRKFDGILCSAVFQHIAREKQFDAAFDIRNLLKPNGRLLLSIPKDRPGIDASDRDEYGRLFTPIVPEELELLFERLGFQRIGAWTDVDSLGRPGISWITLLFILRSDQALRPIDRIEAVLNRDKKIATYKLALVRALCDIALTNYHMAAWMPDGRVSVPIQDIAERWIYYYWPLFEDSAAFIPQIRGERISGRLHIGFRQQLEQLIAAFDRSGGLDAFATALRNDSLDAAQKTLLKAAFARLIPVIKEGPVTHAGRSSEGGQLFAYDSNNRRIIISGDIWRELCLSGHWIQDALILRWGELTAEISKKSVSPSQVIDRLLRTPVYERNVADAKQVYRQLVSKECVWSGKSLSRTFDVDHVLPFSLWRNNDLWNLLPADPRVNRNKGNSLPTHSLMKRRRDAIIGYWDVLHQANPLRFENEINHLAGTAHLDLSNSFNVVLESVEITALQRGCLRWEP
jgi:SAM-dependent methyltransferase